MAREHCKGVGDIFVEIYPFTQLDDASKAKLKDRLNNIASVCLYSNAETKLCDQPDEKDGGDDPENGDSGDGGSGEGKDQQKPKTRPKTGCCGDGANEDGAAAGQTEGGPPTCCHFYEMGTKVRPFQEIKFGIKLAFKDDDPDDKPDSGLVKVKVEFDLKFKTEATGISKNWLCPDVCQQDTTKATVDLIITGTFKPSINVPGFDFDAGISVNLNMRIGLGEFENTCIS